MASFSKGTSFTDGVTGDVTAAKLHALVDAATPVAGLVTDRTAETSVASGDQVLISDASDSNTLKKMTVSNLFKTDVSITSGTGTAGTVAIGPTGDTNTGLFFPAADTIAASTQGTECFRIDSSGNVGIGTTSPSYKLDVNGTIALKSGAPAVVLTKTTNSTNNKTIQNVMDSLGNLIWQALKDAGAGGGNLFYLKRLDENINSIRAQSGGVDWFTIDNLSTSVGIGTVSPSAQLELSNDSAKKPSSNTWTIASDSRLKTNITDADKDRCLEIVRQIPLKRYTWKNEVYSQEAVKDRSKLGWIAQDVESVFPKAVGTNRFAYNQVFEDVVTPELDADGNPVLDEDGNAKTKTEKKLVSEDVIEDCKDLNSDQIYAVMYGAIQKLAEENDSLKTRISVLESA